MGRPARQASCHPTRKHKAKGLCRRCYDRGKSRARRLARRLANPNTLADQRAARLENLQFMVEARVPLKQAVLRAGFPSVSAAERWCVRHHAYHLYAALKHGSHACDYHCPIEWSAR